MPEDRPGHPPGASRAVGVDDTLDAELIGARLGRLPTSLGPKFEILDVMGRGSMGVVLKVRHTELDKVMAVKVMGGGVLSRSQSLRLWREARATSDLDHPNVVRVHDLDRAPDGTPFIVMEMLEGHTLEDEFERHGPLPSDRVIELLSGVADGLDSAHARGVVHRDLKPLNLFLTRDGVVKILDFGICHYDVDESRTSRTGTVVGTPLYMAPEQLRGETPLPQTDIYALASIAWQALAGRPPLDGATLAQILDGKGTPTLPRFAGVAPALPPALSDVFERALAHRPDDRYGSARAFLDAFERAAGAGRPPIPQLGTNETPLPPEPEARGHARGGRARLWRAASFLALAVVLVAGLWVLAERPNGPPGAPSEASGANGASAAAGAKAPPRWPEEVRLLVLPLRHSSAVRSLDGLLWPLVDRLVVNALGADERVFGRLSRVDPADVEREIERRELGATLEPAEIVELAAVLRANVVLEGAVERADGFVRLSGELRPVGGVGGVSLHASHVHLLEAVRTLTEEVRRALWEGRAAAPGTARIQQLLVTRPEAAEALGEADGLASRSEREAIYERVLAADPDAVGAAWRRYLEDVTDAGRRSALGQHATNVPDPELRQFFESLASEREGAEACDGVDPVALGARYPLMLGPLAASVCHYLRGEWDASSRLAARAFDDVALRPLARPVLAKLLFFTRTCDDLLPVLRRVQSLGPEAVRGWSVLANWYARCDRLDDARQMLRVAEALLGDDPETNRRVAYNAAWVHLADLDVDGARAWLDHLEKHREPGAPDGTWYVVTSLALHMQGRANEARAVLAEGVAAFQSQADNVLTMLAASLLYSDIASGRFEAARRTAEEFDAAFSDPSDAGNRYMAQMLSLAVDAAEGRMAGDALRERMAALGADVEAELGDMGRLEREAQECFLATYLADEALAERILRDGSPSNKLLGGCRFRHAEHLLGEGNAAEAAEQYRRALADIIWARFIYAEFVAPAMLGQARALEATGRVDEAALLYERIVRNYARSEKVLPESVAASEALARLGR